MDLKKVARLVANAVPRDQEVAALMGAATEQLSNQQRFDPRDHDFELALVHYREGPDKSPEVFDLTLYPRDAVNLSLGDLRRVFGSDKPIPPNPSGNPDRRCWVFEPDGTKYGVLVVGSFSDDPQAEGSRLTRLDFVRRSR